MTVTQIFNQTLDEQGCDLKLLCKATGMEADKQLGGVSTSVLNVKHIKEGMER